MISNDPTRPEFWDNRFVAGKTPWDLHGVPQGLNAYLSRSTPGRVLIPGCGSAYEVRAFSDAGWSVTAIDFSPAAVARAKKLLGSLSDLVVLGDFFKHPFGEHEFDVAYERTFLCALPPPLWKDYVSRLEQLLLHDGKLIGFFLYGNEPEPPPYPLTEGIASSLLGEAFELTKTETVNDSLPIFAGNELWQEWNRKV